MISIWIKILLMSLGVLTGIALIATSWIIFTMMDGIYSFFHREEDTEC